MVIVFGKGHGDPSSKNLVEAVCISHDAWERYEFNNSFSINEQIIKQTGYFKFGMATRKGKQWIQTC